MQEEGEDTAIALMRSFQCNIVTVEIITSGLTELASPSNVLTGNPSPGSHPWRENRCYLLIHSRNFQMLFIQKVSFITRI